MCLFYISVLSPFLFSCKNVIFSFGGGGGGGNLQSGNSFFDVLVHFLKNALLSLLFHSKMSFMRKNPVFFPHSERSARSNLKKLTNDFFQGARCKTSTF